MYGIKTQESWDENSLVLSTRSDTQHNFEDDAYFITINQNALPIMGDPLYLGHRLKNSEGCALNPLNLLFFLLYSAMTTCRDLHIEYFMAAKRIGPSSKLGPPEGSVRFPDAPDEGLLLISVFPSAASYGAEDSVLPLKHPIFITRYQWILEAQALHFSRALQHKGGTKATGNGFLKLLPYWKTKGMRLLTDDAIFEEQKEENLSCRKYFRSWLCNKYETLQSKRLRYEVFYMVCNLLHRVRCLWKSEGKRFNINVPEEFQKCTFIDTMTFTWHVALSRWKDV